MITITEKDGATIIVISKDCTADERRVIDAARQANRSGWKSYSSNSSGWASTSKAEPKKQLSLVEEVHEAINRAEQANGEEAINIKEDDDYPFGKE